MLPALSKEKTSEYMSAQLEEALSDYNRWLTGEKVGHPPSIDECLYFYVFGGGSADFEKRWKKNHKAP